MKRLILSITILFIVPAANAQWFDDFEGYGIGPLGSPWEDVSSLSVGAGVGCDTSRGVYGPSSNWTRGHAYRPMDGDSNVVYGSFYADSGQTTQAVKIGLTAAKSTGVDILSVEFINNEDGHDMELMFMVVDYEDSDYVTDHRVNAYHLAEDTWYDVKIVLESSTKASGYYRSRGTEEWIKLGSLDVSLLDDFAPNYVGIYAMRKGYLDEVGCEPRDYNEPYLRTDVVQNGHVDTADFGELSDKWLDTGTGIDVDFNDSSNVDFLDYAIFSQYWLACTEHSGSCWDKLVHVAGISSRMRTGSCSGDNWYGEFKVSIENRNGRPVSGVTVDAEFNAGVGGASIGTGSAVTDANGHAVLVTECSDANVITARVTRVSGYYEPELNETGYCYAFGPEKPGQPVLVHWSQGTPDSNMLAQHASYWEDYLPFDGPGWYVVKDDLQGRYGDTTYSGLAGQYHGLSYSCFVRSSMKTADYNDYTDMVANLQAANFEKFHHNFIMLHPSNYQTCWAFDWFDDDLWANTINNARVIARIAYETGCDGIFFDPEQYGGARLWNYMDLRDIYTDNPYFWAQWRNKVKDRANDFIQQVNAEYPGITILMASGASGVHSYMACEDGGYCGTTGGYRSAADMAAYNPPQGVDYSGTSEALLIPFIEGMLEAKDAETTIVDGFETSYFYKTDAEFAVIPDVIKQNCRGYFQDTNLYTNNIHVGTSILPTYTSRTDAVFSPAQIRAAVKAAMKYTEKYVYISSERKTFWVKGGPAGVPLVPNYAFVGYATEPADLYTPGTVENALTPPFYGVPQYYIDAIFDAKAQSLE